MLVATGSLQEGGSALASPVGGTARDSQPDGPSDAVPSGASALHGTTPWPGAGTLGISVIPLQEPLRNLLKPRFSAMWGCARGHASKPSTLPEHARPDSKKVGCGFKLYGHVMEEHPGAMVFTELHGHTNHCPGDAKERRWLDPPEEGRDKVEMVRTAPWRGGEGGGEGGGGAQEPRAVHPSGEAQR